MKFPEYPNVEVPQELLDLAFKIGDWKGRFTAQPSAPFLTARLPDGCVAVVWCARGIARFHDHERFLVCKYGANSNEISRRPWRVDLADVREDLRYIGWVAPEVKVEVKAEAAAATKAAVGLCRCGHGRHAGRRCGARCPCAADEPGPTVGPDARYYGLAELPKREEE